MKLFEFLGLNVVIVGVVVLIVILYLVSLINKRRKSKFLHEGVSKDE
jgi:hypothetical protein